MKIKSLLAVTLILAICSCNDDSTSLKDISLDRLSPPEALVGDYTLVSYDESISVPGNAIFKITEDDYIRVDDGNVVFSLKKKIEKGDIKLLRQLLNPSVWVLYFPDEELRFECTTNGMIITDIYKDNEIIDCYERINK